MSKTLYSQIKPLNVAIEELTQKLGIDKKLQEYNAVLYWEQIVGEQISKMTKAVRIVKGVLFVQVKVSTWRNELTLRKKEIIKKINSVIGTDVVKDIKFQ